MARSHLKSQWTNHKTTTKRINTIGKPDALSLGTESKTKLTRVKQGELMFSIYLPTKPHTLHPVARRFFISWSRPNMYPAELLQHRKELWLLWRLIKTGGALHAELDPGRGLNVPCSDHQRIGVFKRSTGQQNLPDGAIETLHPIKLGVNKDSADLFSRCHRC